MALIGRRVYAHLCDHPWTGRGRGGPAGHGERPDGAAELLANELAGPPLGGLLFSLSRAVPFVLDAASFALSGLLLRTVPGDFRSAGDGQALPSAWQDVREGISWLFHHRVLRSISLAVGVVNLGAMALWGVLVLFAQEILHVGAVGYGLIVASFAVGGLLGSLVATSIGRRFGRSPLGGAAASCTRISESRISYPVRSDGCPARSRPASHR